MTRTCTICRAKVGTPHKRKSEYIWKRQIKNLIQNDKERKADAVKIAIN